MPLVSASTEPSSDWRCATRAGPSSAAAAGLARCFSTWATIDLGSAVNATDPLNLVGLIVPGPTVPAVRTKRVVYVDGIPESADEPVDEPVADTA